MKFSLAFCAFLCLICGPALAQWKHIATLKTHNCVAASLFGTDKILAADQSGNLSAYDSLGRLVATYSAERPMSASGIHAGNPLEVWVFYKQMQQALVLDRFLTPLNSGSIAFPSTIGYAELIAPSNAGDIWAVDRQDFSLKKINVLNKSVVFQVSFDLVLKQKNYDFVYMAEYENQLFLVDQNTGIFVFDNMGNLQNNIPHSSAGIPGFKDQQLYMLSKGKLIFYHLYNGKIKYINAPATQAAATQAINLSGSRIWFFVFADHISIMRYTD